jgi:hypothetical protein
VNRAFDRYYQGEDLEDQLLSMRADVNAILMYFELEHQISIGTVAARGKAAPWDAP